MGAKPPYPHAAILIAAAPASSLLKIGKLGYHRGASGINIALPLQDTNGHQKIGDRNGLPRRGVSARPFRPEGQQTISRASRGTTSASRLCSRPGTEGSTLKSFK